jgi:hypothetical protein
LTGPDGFDAPGRIKLVRRQPFGVEKFGLVFVAGIWTQLNMLPLLLSWKLPVDWRAP